MSPPWVVPPTTAVTAGQQASGPECWGSQAPRFHSPTLKAAIYPRGSRWMSLVRLRGWATAQQLRAPGKAPPPRHGCPGGRGQPPSARRGWAGADARAEEEAPGTGCPCPCHSREDVALVGESRDSTAALSCRGLGAGWQPARGHPRAQPHRVPPETTDLPLPDRPATAP